MEPFRPAPFVCRERRVEPTWIDYNGHMNMAYYHVVFDQSLDQLFDALGIGVDYVTSGRGSCFTVEVHVNYLQEVALDDPLRVAYQLLDWDEKRLHFFGTMHHARDGYLAATSEQLSLHVDMQTRRAGAFPSDVAQRIAALMDAHRALSIPEQVGHVIGIPPERSKRARAT